MVLIRREQPADIAGVRRVNEAAFSRPAEADLVDALRRAETVICSLVAESDGRAVGHALFSPAVLEADGAITRVAALGPVAVAPEHQNRGIGGRLVRAGLEACRDAGYGLCIVLGHPAYYPRFGFRVARPLGIRWEHDAPEEAFMVAELRPGALAGAWGIARYRPEFDGV